MVDEVYGHLAGYGVQSDPVTWLTTELTSTSTSPFSVYSTESAGRGVIEIDDELIWIDSFDSTANTLIPAPFGRGFRGTSGASHKLNTKVVFNPSFTRKSIVTALNDTILSVFPKVRAVGSTTFTYTPSVNTYAIPSIVEDIVSIAYQAIGPSKEWVKVKGWRLDSAADTDAFPSTSTVTLLSYIDPGAKVKLQYTSEPSILESAGDDFADTTGLPESVKDVVVLGAVARLLATIDPRRIQYNSPEAEVQSGRMAVGSAISAAKYVYALYQARLQEESAKQQGRLPVTLHYSN